MSERSQIAAILIFDCFWLCSYLVFLVSVSRWQILMRTKDS